MARPAPPPAVRRDPAAPAASAERHGYPHYKRLERGHRVDRYWSHPGYHVRDHDRYGFYDPPADQRWVRYYDDALLVDRGGMIRDGRYGLDWDQYGEGWGYDERGIPVYVGDGDYYPDDEDYAWVEQFDRGYAGPPPMPHHGYADGYGYGHDWEDGAVIVHHGSSYPPAAYYPYGYGYGWGYGGVTITETTVTTTGGDCCHVEEVVRAPHRKWKQKPHRHHSGPKRRLAPIPYGEKG